MPLHHVVDVNRHALPDNTPEGFEFDYVDIGAVSRQAGIERTVRLAFSEAPSRARRIVSSGDVIVSTVRTYLGATAPVGSKHNGSVCSTGFAVLTARQSINPRYLRYVIVDPAFVAEVAARSLGVSYPAINTSELLRIRVPVPSSREQRSIADFLDGESERIDRLRRTIQSQLDGLQAFEINRRDELLASSKRVPMKSLLRDACVGIVVQPARLYTEDGEVPCFRAVNVHNGTLVDAELMRLSRSDHLENRRSELSEGDVVVVRTGKAGSAAVVPAWASGGNCVDLLVLRVKPECDPRWLVEVINSATTAREIDRASVGTIQGHMNLGAIRQITCPRLDIAGQLRVVSEIQAHRDECECMARELWRVTGLLAEYRDALITEAVTGKLDISRLSEQQMDESAHAALDGEAPEVLSA